MKILITLLFFLSFTFNTILGQASSNTNTNPPIYIAFLWHMHQPIYWPYESVVATQTNNRFPYSVFDIFNQRTGPYTDWPKNAVQKGITAGFEHFGAQVSFSGSLIENLNNLEANGNGNFQNWKSSWNLINGQKTTLNNPRIDMVGFGYHHPLMGLLESIDITKQIEKHKETVIANFGGEYSKGIFPPENAFTERMIPALLSENLEWVLVDNIHFDRTVSDYPYSTSGNIYEPNKSDIVNEINDNWVQLNDIWAPTKVSAKWGHQPHYAQYVNPETGEISKIIVVPSDRYLGNEDGRGGFGALQYDDVMSQFESFNTDPTHPVLLVLAHDGDNFGGGTDAYYGNNFQNFVNWLSANPNRFVCTTIQDYLDMFPPDQDDVIHVESGSWSGADNGDPEFKKWLGDPNSEDYSPDRNSWGVITAAANYVHTAENVSPENNNTKNAWKYFLNGESSDYWYWDFSLDGIWDAHPTRASNLAIPFAKTVITGSVDNTPPTIFQPQREPYNPGGTEWNINQPSDFEVWTYVFDISGLESVVLKYRTDIDGTNSMNSNDNETYLGGNEVNSWVSIPMNSLFILPQTNLLPDYKAKQFSANISGEHDVLIDYYVEATDSSGNIAKSAISHVWVGENNSGGGGTGGVVWLPDSPTNDDIIHITVNNAGQNAKLHWGVNDEGDNWVTPNQVYWTDNTSLFNGSGPAVESDFSIPDSSGNITLSIVPFNNSAQEVNRIVFVIHYSDDSWDNNNGQNYHIILNADSIETNWIMDGNVDSSAALVADNNGIKLYAETKSNKLYVATQSAAIQNNDVFVFISDNPVGTLPKPAPWGKSGEVSAWTLFLGNESTNNWSGWFDQSGIVENSSNNFLEGVINLENEFSTDISIIYIGIGLYGTNDGDQLVKQLPSGNGDSNIDPSEFYAYNIVTSINDDKIKPLKFNLAQNYPNPFNPTTIIRYTISNNSENYNSQFVILKVYDILGKEVETLVNEEQTPGKYQVNFSADNLTSGVYFYKLSTNGVAGTFNQTKKMLLLR